MIKITKVLIVCIIILPFAIYSYAEVLFGKEYYETVRKHIAQAEESIVVAMYFIIMEPEDETSPINILVNELIAAKKRGVEVKVVIDDGRMGISLDAYNKLKKNGVYVRPDLPGKRMHTKAVVIDGRYVFLGSANWSGGAFEDNYEANVFIDSESEARELTQFIENTILCEEGSYQYDGIALPVSFLLSPEKGHRFVKEKAYTQLDLYLLLNKMYRETGKSTFKIDYEQVAKEMGYDYGKGVGAYRSKKAFYYDKLHGTLKHLRKKGLIDYDKGIVTLMVEGRDTPHLIIPFEYWEYGYDKFLISNAKYMYLICLYEASRSTRYPYWSHSQEDMAKLYGISRHTILRGLAKLEKAGIIEVTRSKLRPPDFSARKANVYKLLPLRPLN